jgi:SH3 domain protein
MKRSSLVLIIITGLFLYVHVSWAADAYVTDSFKITLRTGPSTVNKIMAMLSSGQALDVIGSEGEWSHVRIVEGTMNGQEGWVLSRYLMDRTPWEKQYNVLQGKNSLLKEKMPTLQEKLKSTMDREKELSIALNDTTRQLNTLEKKYEALKSGAAGYLKLKQTHEVTTSTLEKAEKDVKNLTDENKSLKSSQAIRWFLAGALVLLFGLMIGLVMGQRQKKYRSSVYS